jgi:predicted nucleic acid-binding protein
MSLRAAEKVRRFDADLADLGLLALAERSGVREIVTVEARDSAVYRLAGNRALTNLLVR